MREIREIPAQLIEDGLVIYDSPTQGYDWTLSNKGEGRVLLSFVPGETYIGDLKSQLRALIKSLDRAAEHWGVANNLDARGRARSE